ncbi:MAG: Rrf2 family transcriptional regulator [candidate division WOR-3 bacterium]
MKLLTKESDYALRALHAAAASAPRSITAAALARRDGISWLFLRRVMQRLAQLGMLSSHRGRHGGFALARPAGQITLADVITAFQGRIELSECLVRGRPCCRRPNCPVRKRLRLLGNQLRQGLEGISIAMLCESHGTRRDPGSQAALNRPAKARPRDLNLAR